MPNPNRGEGVTDETTENGLSRAPSPTDSSLIASAQEPSSEGLLESHALDLGLLFVGHGSRRSGSNAEFESLVQTFAERFPAPLVGFGYGELAKPTLAAAIKGIAQERKEIVLVPTFLFLAGHVKNDLPLALAQAREEHSDVRFTVAPPLGVDHRLCELAWSRAEAALGGELSGDQGPTKRDEVACLLVGRGSSDPDANGDFYKTARLVAERFERLRVEPCFLGISQPDVPSGLELLAKLRPKRIVVVPYLLFAGRLMERLRESIDSFQSSHPWLDIVMAEHLGPDPVILDVLAERALGALSGVAPLPCDTCQYREPLPGRVLQAGGLRALLWSMRHTFTHSQAMPAEHAHPRVDKHVFVCTNVDCAKRGSVALLHKLRTEIKTAGMSRSIRVTRTACMGRCGEGPSVAVYPDGVWYRNVAEEDASELLEEHLKSDRLVARLVDNILQ